MNSRNLIRAALPVITCRSGLRHLVSRRYGGAGTIFMLHRIIDDDDKLAQGGLCCPVTQLVHALTWLREQDIDFIALDELPERLQTRSRRPFAAFTFDDGYADALTHALPIMERFGAPFTVYVPTGTITREIDAWWLALAELFNANDEVTFESLEWSFRCHDRTGKSLAFEEVERAIHSDFSLLPEVKATIKRYGIECRALVDRIALTSDGLRKLSQHPLVTIGGHGINHENLLQRSADAVRWEMTSNRAFLETIIERPIMHFAYPFGTARSCGEREAQIARSVGFRTAVTTRHGSIFRKHLEHLHALPRECITRDDSPDTMRCKLDGFYRAVQSFWGDPIAEM